MGQLGIKFSLNLLERVFESAEDPINVNFGYNSNTEFGGFNYHFNNINKNQFSAIEKILNEPSNGEEINISDRQKMHEEDINFEILEIVNVIHDVPYFKLTARLKDGSIKYIRGNLLDDQCPEFITDSWAKIENDEYSPV